MTTQHGFPFARAKQLFEESSQAAYQSIDRLFGYLMMCQFVVAVAWAAANSPRTWEGNSSFVHPHVWTALFLGGLIALPTIALTRLMPGATCTRWTISVTQMLMSALLIHVSGGRIETHFHVFGSLAFLSFYRDWKLLIPATVVVAADHFVRGIYIPASVYGVYANVQWRFIEHASWVVFEDIILVAACLRGSRELHLVADRQALLEATNEEIEGIVQVRTGELGRSQERKTAILNNALDAIISMDAAGKVIEFNPAAEAMFERKKEDVIGKDLAELLIPEEMREQHRVGLARYMATGQAVVLNQRIEITALRSNGECFPIELSITSVNVDDHKMFTAFIRDIGHKKQLEAELAHAQKMESIGQLSAGVAHEINTPNQYIGDNIRYLEESFGNLNEAIGGLRELHEAAKAEGNHPDLVAKIDETAARTDLEFVIEEIPRAVGQALEGVDRVASIVRAMKDFSHPGQDELTTVDLNRVIDSTVTVTRNEWKFVAKVELDLEEHLPAIQGHPGELGQVVLNLIINSVHAISDQFGEGGHGLIRITTRTMEDQIELVISDNGCGIPEHAKARIFEPFYTTKGVGMGTGQGLAISHAVITERHGGRIDFVSALEEGTTFRIRLPIESTKEAAA